MLPSTVVKAKEFEDGKLTLEDLVAYAKTNGEPKQTSGKQGCMGNREYVLLIMINV